MVVCVCAAYRDRATCLRLSELLGLRMAQLWNNSRDCWMFPSNRMMRAAHTIQSRCSPGYTGSHRLGLEKSASVLLTAQYTVYQCRGKLLLKVMHYNIALLHKKVTNYVTLLLFMESNALCYFCVMSRAWLFVFNIISSIYSKCKSFHIKKCNE